jgi:hypothetical protein
MKTTWFISFMTVCSLQAGVVIETGPPNNNSTDIVNSRLADDFTLANLAGINDINFWYQAQFQTDLTSVAYAFYADSNGALGSLLSSGVAVPTTSIDTNAYLASLSIDTVDLLPGTYWLELHSGTSLTDNAGFNVWWASSDTGGTNLALLNNGLGLPNSPITVSGFQHYAYQLESAVGGGGPGEPPPDATPEPSTLLLSGCGLAVFFTVKHRRGSGAH